MQSIRQFRRFGARAQAQYDHNRNRAEVIAAAGGQSSDDAQLGSTAVPSEAEEEGHRPSSIESRQEVEKPAPEYPSAEAPDEGIRPTPPAVDDGVEEKCGSADGEDDEEEEEEEEEAAERPVDLEKQPTARSFGTRLGHALSGIEVRKLSPEVTRKRRGAHGKGASPLSLTTIRSNITSATGHSHTAAAGGDAETALPEQDTVFVVGFESPDDDQHPQNWAYRSRVMYTLVIACVGWTIGFASSVDSPAMPRAAKEFHVSEVAESLATGLFLAGIGWGALVAGPISEAVGRNPVYIISLGIYMIWLMASGLAPNLGSQLVFRFLAGFFGATPMTCAGGSLSDLWTPMERVMMFPLFAISSFVGPVAGPLVGGFISQSSHVSWRWCEWVTLIISGVVLTMVIIFQPETYPPILMKWKAEHMRRITGDERYVSEVEIRSQTFIHRLGVALYRPFLIFVQEPTVILFSLYMTVVYIIMFGFLDGFTFMFGDTYGFSEGLTGLAFIGIMIGILVTSILVPIFHKKAQRMLKELQESEGPDAKLSPEIRLWYAMMGGPMIPISLFWMAWTNYPSISPWSTIAATLPFGFGLMCIFISTYQYIIDSYEIYAASALACVTITRYNASGAIVLVGIPFYKNVGNHWTLTILAFLSLVMVPVPWVFWKYGHKIRGWSKFAQDRY